MPCYDIISILKFPYILIEKYICIQYPIEKYIEHHTPTLLTHQLVHLDSLSTKSEKGIVILPQEVLATLTCKMGHRIPLYIHQPNIRRISAKLLPYLIPLHPFISHSVNKIPSNFADDPDIWNDKVFENCEIYLLSFAFFFNVFLLRICIIDDDKYLDILIWKDR